MNAIDIVTLSLIFMATAGLALVMGSRLRLPGRITVLLLCWHTLFCVIYWLYAQDNPADANRYYRAALLGEYDWRPGTRFVESFTTLIVDLFGFGKLSTFLVYNAFGVAGLLLLAHIVFGLWPYCKGVLRYVPYAILFMPGLSFWSAAIGKDAPAFFAACLAAYSFLKIERRKVLFGAAVLVMFAVRPQVAAIMVMAAMTSFLFSRGIGPLQRVAGLLLIAVAAYLFVPYAITSAGLGDEFSVDAVTEYIETRQTYNITAGGGVDISSMPLPLQMFTYLFRPLFFDAPGMMGLVASVENLLLLSLCLLFFPRAMTLLWRDSSIAARYNLIYAIVGLAIFAMITANMGIAVRQKTMLLPSIFFLIAYAANVVYTRKRRRTEQRVALRHKAKLLRPS